MRARGHTAPRRAAIDAQPRLPLAFTPAVAGVGISLERSTPCAGAFDGDDWLFTVDWDGSRCLLIVDGDGSVRLQGENTDLDGRFPEVTAAAVLQGGRAAVLDGVICVLDDQGRPRLDALARRAAAGSSWPHAVYLATDLLHLDGAPLTRRPLRDRLGLLADLVVADSRIQLPDHVAGQGIALAAATASRDLPAVLARRHDSPYRAGVASPDRLRISLCERREAVVVACEAFGSDVRVLFADWVEGRLCAVGTALVEDPSLARWLLGVVEPSPVVVEGIAAVAGTAWVRPRIVAALRPAPVASVRGLPTWTVVALRDDVDPAWCVRRSPVAPPQDSSSRPPRPFSPTVLSALPLDGAA